MTEIKERHPANVITAIQKNIPEDKEWDTLRMSLKSVRDSALYTAPEMMHGIWTRLNMVLTHELGPEDTDWKKKIGMIVRDEDPSARKT